MTRKFTLDKSKSQKFIQKLKDLRAKGLPISYDELIKKLNKGEISIQIDVERK